MIRATDRNFEMFHGDTFRMAFAVIDYDTQLPVDITASSLTMTAKAKVKDTDAKAVFRKTSLTGGGITIPDPVLGKVLVEIVPQDTSSVAQKETELYADVKIHMADGQVYTLVTIVLLVRPSPTGTPL
jgi:hypothetical protein